MSATCTTQRVEGHPVFVLTDVLDLQSAVRLRHSLFRALIDAPMVVADLTEVRIDDIRAVGALALASQAARISGRELRVVGSSVLQPMIALLGLATRITVYHTVEAALSVEHHDLTGQPG